MADYRGAAVLLLREAGPQGQAARPDLRKACGGLAGDGWGESCDDAGFARAANPGLFRRAGGSFVWFPGVGRALPALEFAESNGSLAGCGRRGARAVFRE